MIIINDVTPPSSGLLRTRRPGTYLLRDGTHKNAKYVSVWGTK